MLKHREIRLSIYDRVKAMFQTPDVATGLLAYNVYGESDFRNVNFVPTFPYVYLLDSFIQPLPQRVDRQQPQVVFEIDTYRRLPFEMGNRNGRRIRAYIHVFGQNRGQRDDLSAFIGDYFGTALAIKTYPSGVTVEDALLDDEIIVEDMYTPRIESIESQATLLGWSRVTFSFTTKL